MALTDIIAAITAQADKEVAIIQEQVAREKSAYKKKTDEAIVTATMDMRTQTDARKEQMKKKVHTSVEMERKKTLLTEKRATLADVYTSALAQVQNLPKEKLHDLEKALKKRIDGRKGDIQEAKGGGFVFVSDIAEEDLTFPHLMKTMVRPSTELEASAKLFT